MASKFEKTRNDLAIGLALTVESLGREDTGCGRRFSMAATCFMATGSALFTALFWRPGSALVLRVSKLSTVLAERPTIRLATSDGGLDQRTARSLSQTAITFRRARPTVQKGTDTPKRTPTCTRRLTVVSSVIVENAVPLHPVDTRRGSVYATREEWLLAAADLMRPWLQDLGAKTPECRISCGWSKKAGKGIGWAWKCDAAKDFIGQVFISPELEDPGVVLATELHELIHISDDGESKHSGHFKRIAVAVGLTGRMTATIAGPELLLRLADVAKQLGPYPHSRLEPKAKIGAQTTRMIKVSCPHDGYTVRCAKKWIEVGLPACPSGHEMEAEIKDAD